MAPRAAVLQRHRITAGMSATAARAARKADTARARAGRHAETRACQKEEYTAAAPQLSRTRTGAPRA